MYRLISTLLAVASLPLAVSSIAVAATCVGGVVTVQKGDTMSEIATQCLGLPVTERLLKILHRSCERIENRSGNINKIYPSEVYNCPDRVCNGVESGGIIHCGNIAAKNSVKSASPVFVVVTHVPHATAAGPGPPLKPATPLDVHVMNFGEMNTTLKSIRDRILDVGDLVNNLTATLCGDSPKPGCLSKVVDSVVGLQSAVGETTKDDDLTVVQALNRLSSTFSAGPWWQQALFWVLNALCVPIAVGIFGGVGTAILTKTAKQLWGKFTKTVKQRLANS